MIADFLLIFFSLLIGASLGSFTAATYLRIRAGQSLAGRSSCPDCGQQIRIRDNIPIISWLALGGKSSCCQKPISSFYLKVEITSTFLFLSLALCLIALS